MREKILYVEDNPELYGTARRTLESEFPDYKTIIGTSLPHVEQLLERRDRRGQQIKNITDIAVVCTDCSLAQDTYGWDVVKLLRERGYTGKVIYTGANSCPEDKEHLFDAFSPTKTGDELVRLIREAL